MPAINQSVVYNMVLVCVNVVQSVQQVDRLEILDDAACSSTNIEVGWRPPNKNSERITSFKLMVATSTGVVREVRQLSWLAPATPRVQTHCTAIMLRSLQTSS